MEWVFGECVLSEDLFHLKKAGRVVKLEPKVFQVFRFLVENRERVVSKADILDHVWPGEAISESVLPRSIAVIRRAVGDTRAKQEVIETVHGHGYRFVAVVDAPSDSTPSHAPRAQPTAASEESDFVGRHDVVQRVVRALDDTLAGRGRIALLVGEPGIGKTRTVQRLLEEVGGRAGTYVGSCFEGDGAPSYWPFVQILRALVDDTDDDTIRSLRAADADLALLVPELADRLPSRPSSEPLEGEQARFRLFDSLAGFLRRTAKQRPLVLVLEDLHWADRDSMLLTSFLADALRDSAVMIVGTYRDLDVRREHPLGSLLRDLARAPHCERIVLRGLEPEHVVELLNRTAGREIEDRISQAIVEMTEGNPFFVRELALLVSEGGDFDVDEKQVLPLELPQGIRDAVGLRLATLSPACNALLRRAAVIGREWGGRVLFELGDESHEAQLELLGEALAAGVLREHSTAGRYAFSHALVRQTLYDELGLEQAFNTCRPPRRGLSIARRS